MNGGHHPDVTKRNYEEELIRLINYPDFMLYDHFNNTFWRKIEQVGLERVESMVEQIKNYSKNLEEKCVAGYGEMKAWNGKLISEPHLNPNMSSNLECKASVLWGTEQSEFLKARQQELIERENWQAT